MRIMVTGSSGYLGKALVNRLGELKQEVTGIDVVEANETTLVGSITNKALLEKLSGNFDIIIHTAGLHYPHLNTHSKYQFIDVNVTGTQILLDFAKSRQVKSFIFTSTTSTFGHALHPSGKEPAVWVNEDLRPIPKNIYGLTKIAAENLCQLAHQETGLNCIILRTSRFFQNDLNHAIPGFSQANITAIEYLYRRAHLSDIVSAHIKAIERAPAIGFDQFILAATTPFQKSDCAELSLNAPATLERYYPSYKNFFSRMGWQMLPSLNRVYDNQKAREGLGWIPQYNFNTVLESEAFLQENL